MCVGGSDVFDDFVWVYVRRGVEVADVDLGFWSGESVVYLCCGVEGE